MTSLLRFAAALLVSALPCTVQQTDQTITDGELVLVDAKNATVRVNGESETIPIDAIQTISATTPPATDRPELSSLIELTDTSQMVIHQITMQRGEVTLTPWTPDATDSASPPSDTNTSVPILTDRKLIRWLRFGAPSDRIEAQWNDIVKAEHKGDTLIIRKGTDALDFLEGVVVGIDPAVVTFQFDGDEIPVKRTKLEGILFYQRKTTDKAPEPAFIASLRAGTRLKGNLLTVDNDRLTISTPAGLNWTEPLDALRSIDYAVGRTLFLSDADPAQLVVTPQIGSVLNDDLTRLLYQPRNNRDRHNQPLSLRFPDESPSVRTFRKGLCLHSRTEVTYRLGGQYRQLQGIAGFAPNASEYGSVEIIIKTDDQEQFTKTIQSGQAPIALEVDVTGKRRVTIIVDYGDQLDVGDRVHLCDLRVTK